MSGSTSATSWQRPTRSFADFSCDDILRRAVLQRLTEIGEAASRLSRELRARHPDVEWTDVVAFRNIAVHAYFAVSWKIVWVTATRNVPELAQRATAILAAEYPAAASSDAGRDDTG